MAQYSPDLLDEIRARIDLVDLVSDFVTLKRAGENWKGLCPFHTEKTPSFMVNPKKGIFHCFGCGAGGDAFGFLMRQNRLSFPEAVRTLADRAGVTLPTRAGPEEAQAAKREPLYEAMELAAAYYERALWDQPEGERARRYLQARGITPEAARRFRLGYAPEGWEHLLQYAKGSGVDEAVLLQVGLVLPRSEGRGVYDRFRGRLIFPIADVQGRMIAFGGRSLGPEEPKYLNSPETPLYVKGQTLYALHLAKHAIRETGRVVVVEGYLDCLAAQQTGFGETVAALGTAFTPAQVSLLKRYTDEIITAFDADAAGESATLRGLDLLVSSGLRVRVAALPGGEDPDSLIQKQGVSEFRATLDRAEPLLLWALAGFPASALQSFQGRVQALRNVGALLAKIPDPTEARLAIQEVARRFALSETFVEEEVRRLRGIAKRPAAPPAPVGQQEVPFFDKSLVHYLLHSAEARRDLLPVVTEDDLSHPDSRAVITLLKAHPEAEPEKLVSLFEEQALQGLVTGLLLTKPREVDIPDITVHFRRQIELRRGKQESRVAHQALAAAQSQGQADLSGLVREHVARARKVRGLAMGGESGSSSSSKEPNA